MTPPPRARRKPPARPGWEEAFLAEFARCGVVTYAAEAADVSRTTVYEHIRADPVFSAAFRDAEDRAADVLESAAFERAVDGWAEPVYHQGKIWSGRCAAIRIGCWRHCCVLGVRSVSVTGRMFGIPGRWGSRWTGCWSWRRSPRRTGERRPCCA